LISRKILPLLLVFLSSYVVLNIEPIQAKHTATLLPLYEVSMEGIGFNWETLRAQELGYPSAPSRVGTMYSNITNRYYVWRSMARWDLSSFNKNRIASARLLLNVSGNQIWSGSFIVKIQRWTDAADGVPEPPFEDDDYSSFDGINYDDGSFNTTVIPNPANFYIASVPLQDLSVINQTGFTDLFLRSSMDVFDIAPTTPCFFDMSYPTAMTLEITYTGKPLDLLPDAVSLGIPTFFVIVGLVVILMEKKP
jgi:hypothetical protein